MTETKVSYAQTERTARNRSLTGTTKGSIAVVILLGNQSLIRLQSVKRDFFVVGVRETSRTARVGVRRGVFRIGERRQLGGDITHGKNLGGQLKVLSQHAIMASSQQTQDCEEGGSFHRLHHRYGWQVCGLWGALCCNGRSEGKTKMLNKYYDEPGRISKSDLIVGKSSPFYGKLENISPFWTYTDKPVDQTDSRGKVSMGYLYRYLNR